MVSPPDATPKAAELAAQHDIDLESIEGTGAGGKITVTDVRRAVEQILALQKVNLSAFGGFVQSVFGPWGAKTMIELPTAIARHLFPGPLSESGAPDVVRAIEAELAALRENSEDVATSAQALAAVRLAYELQDPHNSATSKAMCAKQLSAIMDRLRELAPAGSGGGDALDELARRRAERLADAVDAA